MFRNRGIFFVDVLINSCGALLLIFFVYVSRVQPEGGVQKLPKVALFKITVAVTPEDARAELTIGGPTNKTIIGKFGPSENLSEYFVPCPDQQVSLTLIYGVRGGSDQPPENIMLHIKVEALTGLSTQASRPVGAFAIGPLSGREMPVTIPIKEVDGGTCDG
jgi:hypothetical protein